MNMRKEIWSQLGAKTGEKWTVVEAKVYSLSHVTHISLSICPLPSPPFSHILIRLPTLPPSLRTPTPTNKPLVHVLRPQKPPIPRACLQPPRTPRLGRRSGTSRRAFFLQRSTLTLQPRH